MHDAMREKAFIHLPACSWCPRGLVGGNHILGAAFVAPGRRDPEA
jgi:hypothetical protein